MVAPGWVRIPGTDIYLRLSVPTVCPACTSRDGRDTCPRLGHQAQPVSLARYSDKPPDLPLLCPEGLSIAGYACVDAHHYPPGCLGAGRMGPSSIEHILGFCRELQGVLRRGKGAGVYCSSRYGACANTALLVGAYLMIQIGMSAAEARACLPPHATRLAFPLPWSAEPEFQSDSLTVADCLQGLAFALSYGRAKSLPFDLASWHANLKEFDASVVCQLPLDEEGSRMLKVVAIADPVTTVADPTVRPRPPKDGFIADYFESVAANAETRRLSDPVAGRRNLYFLEGDIHARFTSEEQPPGAFTTEDLFAPKPAALVPVGESAQPVWDRQASPSESALSMHSRTSRCTPRNSTATPPNSPPMSPSRTWLEEERVRHFGLLEHEKVSKVPVKVVKKRGQVTMPEFASWMQAMGCMRLVRLNFSDEPNLPKCGSYGDYFTHWQIPQVRLEFQDATVPTRDVVRSFIEIMDCAFEEARLHDGAGQDVSVVVHCTAGLGRTMTLLGAWATSRLPVSGGAWLGWARMCRPGSVQTLKQEAFLKRRPFPVPEGLSPCCVLGHALRLFGCQTADHCKSKRLANQRALFSGCVPVAGRPLGTGHVGFLSDDDDEEQEEAEAKQDMVVEEFTI